MVKEWFYPVDPDGWEFVYPRSRAVEPAKAANKAAPSMPPNLASNITKQAKNLSEANVKAMTNTSLKAEQANGTETTIGESFSAKSPN